VSISQRPRRPWTFIAPIAAFAFGFLVVASPASAANFASLQGQSKGSTTWVAGNLSNWEELDPIPMRLLIDPASGDVNNVSTITIEYDHTKTKGGSVYQGLDRPRGFAVATGDESKVQCLNCASPVRSEPTGSDTWSVSFQVRPLVATKSAITFTTRLRAGAHYFTGSSLALGGTANPGGGLGQLQVSKPLPKSGSPDLQLTKTGPALATPGSQISYTLNYGNSSLATSVATGIQLTDTLPIGITYVSGCAAPTCSVSADGRTLVWDLEDFEIGASGSVSFIATVAGDLPYGTVATNTAEINSAENDANFVDNRASASTEIRFNRAPMATAQSVSTAEETAKTVTLSGSDPDGDSVGFKITSLPAHGALYEGSSELGTHIASAGFVLAGNQVTYVPNPNYNGPDSFSFGTNDGILDSTPATVSLTVTPVNDAPTANDDASSTTTEDSSSTTIDLRPLVSDLETDDSNLGYAIVSGPSRGTLTAGATNGTFDYSPDPDYNGPDSFTYEVTDRGDPDNCGSPSASCDSAASDQGTVSLAIAPVNDAPNTSASPSDATLDEDTETTIALSGSDVETATTNLQFTITGLPGHGALTKDGAPLAEGDSFTGSPTDVVYAPYANYNGADSFSFKVNDGSVDSSPATVSLTVTPVNDAPSAADDSTPTTTEDASPTTVDLRPLVSDVETGDSNLTYAIASAPSHGDLAAGTTNGTFSYTPDPDYNGPDSFAYEVTDRGDPDDCGTPSENCDAAKSDHKTVSLTVTPVNDTPTASDGNGSTIDEDASSTTIDLRPLVSDLETDDSNLAYAIVSAPSHGSLTADPTNGRFDYSPDSDYNGPDSFTYEVTDRGDPDNCGTPSADCDAAKSERGTVPLTVEPVNDPPTAHASPQVTGLDEDTHTTITLQGADTETPASSLQFTIRAGPLHGALSREGSRLDTTDSFTGSPADVVYTPDPDYNGPDEFIVQTYDGELYSSPVTISITVNPVNDVPTATDNPNTTVAENSPPTMINLRPLVADVETSRANLAYTIVSRPRHGTLQSALNGTLGYEPDAGYSGADSFTYKVTDRGDPDNCATVPSGSCTSQRESAVMAAPITITPRPVAPTPQPATEPQTSKPVETVPIERIAKLPRRCASRRHFRIRLRAPRREQLVEARVFVNGRQVRVIKGQRLTAPVDLRGLPKGRFKVKIVVTTASGRQLAGTRRYRTCTPRVARKHKRPPRL
jgi:uncharacterized repeat protein (TIGR01451 family)